MAFACGCVPAPAAPSCPRAVARVAASSRSDRGRALPVLDRHHRLTSSSLFSSATRRGRRAGTRTVVLHLLIDPTDAVPPVEHAGPQAGFVVSKAVGNAVTRNRVKRRLRHLVRARLASLPRQSVLVVRALAPSAEASSARLGTDLEIALRRLGVQRSLPPASTT